MNQVINNIGYRLRRIYRIAFDRRNPEQVFWSDLKKYHAEANFNSGIFEKEKTIESIFGIGEDRSETYYHQVYDGNFHCRVKVLHSFAPELTTDIFILASHFNNLLNTGIVAVNVDSQYVEYHVKRDILVPFLYNAEIHTQVNRHYYTSKDVYYAFTRLVKEQESPAIIIADLLRNKENEEKTAE